MKNKVNIIYSYKLSTKLRHTLSPHDFYQQKIQRSTYKSATEGVPLNIFIASRVISNNGRLPNIL